MTQAQNQLPPKGHNNPPSPVELTQERLKYDYEPMLVVGRELVEKAKKLLPTKVENKDISGQFSDLSKQIAGHVKSLDSKRTDETEPHLAQQRTINAFFNTPIDFLKETRLKLDGSVKSFLDAEFRREQEEMKAEAKRKADEAKAQVTQAVDFEEAGLNKAAESTFIKAQVSTNEAVQQEAKAAALKPADVRTRGTSSLATLGRKWKGQVTDYEKLDLNKLKTFFNQEAIDKAVNAFVKNGGRELEGVAIFQDTTLSTR